MSRGARVKQPELRPSIFGADQPYYDLDPFMPAGTGSIVVATGGAHGFRPYGVLLPHQLYPSRLPDLSGRQNEVWVLPVLSPWLQVVGPEPGVWHPEGER